GKADLKAALNHVDLTDMATKLNIGEPTLEDIIKSLIAPNRDPRDEFETPILKSDVLSIEDLSKDMKLSVNERNIIDCEVFVNIDFKQNSLVHISKITKKCFKNPMDVVSVGDIVDI